MKSKKCEKIFEDETEKKNELKTGEKPSEFEKTF
jgi:hypothetical protein